MARPTILSQARNRRDFEFLRRLPRGLGISACLGLISMSHDLLVLGLTSIVYPGKRTPVIW
jgi:hypothetical protein